MKKLTTLVIALACCLFSINTTVEAASKNRAENLAEEMADRGESGLKKLKKGEFGTFRAQDQLQKLIEEFIAKSRLMEELLDERNPNLAQVKVLADQALNLTLQMQKIAAGTNSKDLQKVMAVWVDVASRLVAEVKGLLAEQRGNKPLDRNQLLEIEKR